MGNEIIVSGGSDYADYIKLHVVLSKLKPTRIIQSGAKGADELARIWAKDNDAECVTIKNDKMLNTFQNAIVVAFPGGGSTFECIDAALGMKRLVLQVL